MAADAFLAAAAAAHALWPGIAPSAARSRPPSSWAAVVAQFEARAPGVSSRVTLAAEPARDSVARALWAALRPDDDASVSAAAAAPRLAMWLMERALDEWGRAPAELDDDKATRVLEACGAIPAALPAPAGGSLLAELVAFHLRTQPTTFDCVAALAAYGGGGATVGAGARCLRVGDFAVEDSGGNAVVTRNDTLVCIEPPAADGHPAAAVGRALAFMAERDAPLDALQTRLITLLSAGANVGLHEDDGLLVWPRAPRVGAFFSVDCGVGRYSLTAGAVTFAFVKHAAGWLFAARRSDDRRGANRAPRL